jgi:hypothetical protein
MRTLTKAERAQVISAARGSIDAQREFAKSFSPETFAAWRGWTWGRYPFEIKIGRPDPVPNSARVVMSLEQIEYVARKRDDDGIARRATYVHEHEAPYAIVVTTDEAAPNAPTIATSRRGAPSYRGPALFVLGELHGMRGTAPNGRAIYKRAPRGMLLVGCPVTHDLHVIRQGAARSSAPLWILRNRSPYRLTDAGIVR